MPFFFMVVGGTHGEGGTMTHVREHLVWHRRCGNNACIEVAQDNRETLVRDSNDPAGPWLAFAHRDWAAFLSAIRNDRI